MAVDTLEAALQNYIATDASILAITTHANSQGVSRENIYPIFAPRKTTAPYIVYRRTDTDRDRMHNSAGLTGMSGATFSITCWATTHDGAMDLADLVRTRLDGAGRGGANWDSVIVNGVMVTDISDTFEAYPELVEKQLYGRELTVEIRYEE